ncbi:MAG: TonB-dependent receptor [Holophagaceae bacterium]|nr:TonB-dependent receptor [Holophagaceae bacterium]
MLRNSFNLSRIAVLLAFGSTAALVAQGVQYGTVSGTVKSSKGAAVAGARVTITTGQGIRTAVADASGNFRFPQLVPQSNTKVSVSADGYIGASIETRVGVDRNNIVDFTLKPVADVSTTVVVTASAGVIDSTEAKTGANLSLESINDLPINNRNITAIASLSPGVSSDSNGITVRGSQATQVQYLVDGADVMDPVTGGPAVRLNEEMLEEVQVISGAASAEYGRFTGGVVNTVTKSGTNEFHGVARWDATNPKWNAYNPLNRGASGKTEFLNHTGVIQQYVVSGPIIKDHLFFVVGYRTTSPMTTFPGTTSSGDFGGVAFVRTVKEERKDLKLDWQINNSHKVFWQYNKTVSQSLSRDYATLFGYGSTSLETLSDQADDFSYVTFGYLGQLTSSLLLDVRMNQKKETLGGSAGPSGGKGGKNTPMWIDTQTYDIFDNGFFSNDGDSRPIRTANASLSWFVDAAGSHEIKTGIQLYESKRAAANAQTPSNYMIYFDGFNTPGSSAASNRHMVAGNNNTSYLEFWEPIFGAITKNTITGLYINDKWKVNSNWALNLGLRYDKFVSKDDLGRDNFSISGVSPRLSAIWDIKGDASKVLSANYSIYQGQVIQGATDASSPAGNPVWHKFSYLGGNPLKADGTLNRAAFSNTEFYLEDPFRLRNTTIDPNLKPPQMTEIAVNYATRDEKGSTWTLGLTKRKWDNMVDDFKTVVGTDLKTTIKNDNSVSRDYIGMEITYQNKVYDNFNIGGNMTLSRLRGNYEGGQVGTTEQRNNFGPNGPADRFISPYGNLAADRPIAIVANADYKLTLGRGTMNFGFLGLFTSGAPYSLTQTGVSTNVTGGYDTTYTRFNDGQRGQLRFPDNYRVDFQIAYDIKFWKTLDFFVRMNVTNLFNTQLVTSWNTTISTKATSGLLRCY